MKEEKFLSYCPNCQHYDPDTGACNYIHENVKEYPSRFIKYCNGEYLHLIKGKKIGLPEDFEPEVTQDEEELVTVFSDSNFGVFNIAKHLLDNAKIRYWCNGEYYPPYRGRGIYQGTIKVFTKDESMARELLGGLTDGGPYVPSNEKDKKIQSFVGRWGIWIIIILLLIFAFIIMEFRNW